MLSCYHNEQHESYNNYIVKIIIHIDPLSAIYGEMDLRKENHPNHSYEDAEAQND